MLCERTRAVDVWPLLFSTYAQSLDNLFWCHAFHVVSMWMTPKVSPSHWPLSRILDLSIQMHI